jgi:hypothetical protein
VVKGIKAEFNYRFRSEKDNHDPGVATPILYTRLLKPLRVRWQELRLSSQYVTMADLPALDYAFFALHTEPEVTLSIHGRVFLNQIEVIRNLSQSIPVGMTLVVKEHPHAVGKRRLSYYRKILEIPNVRLADPTLAPKILIEHATLAANIAGSIAWEAVLRRTPAIVFGHTPYEFLPSSMLRRVADMNKLPEEIADLLESYEYRDDAVEAYVAATMSESTPINLYTTLLGREGVYSLEPDTVGSAGAWRRDIGRLAAYTIDTLRIRGFRVPGPSTSDPAQSET